ncbi:MAG: hypothetical protein HZA60_08060, partial [Deltaproteobacteria bacterium]|nr:hypothetical protein [Deltaproteobacteria bacterium]
GRRYPEPLPADLMERAADPQRFKRTIVKPLDPRDWNIKVDQYLPQGGEGAAFR